MKTILIVEDDAKSRYLAKFILEKGGYRVVEAGDGQEALEKAAAEKPDLILMDMQLPRLDGYETTARLRADAALRHTPVVALTAYAMKGDREKALRSGCTGYMTKPIDPATFQQEVEKHLP
ncbi:MAG: response regulator [Elusimicrobia bacterium]|nr:response regulator [Elusimicrobiota bacterium]